MSLLVNGNVGEFVGSDPFQLMDFPAIVEIKSLLTCAVFVNKNGWLATCTLKDHIK